MLPSVSRKAVVALERWLERLLKPRSRARQREAARAAALDWTESSEFVGGLLSGIGPGWPTGSRPLLEALELTEGHRPDPAHRVPAARDRSHQRPPQRAHGDRFLPARLVE